MMFLADLTAGIRAKFVNYRAGLLSITAEACDVQSKSLSCFIHLIDSFSLLPSPAVRLRTCNFFFFALQCSGANYPFP